MDSSTINPSATSKDEDKQERELSEEEKQKLKLLADQCKALQSKREWGSLESKALEWAELEPNKIKPWLYAATAAQELGGDRKELFFLDELYDSVPLKEIPVPVLFRRADLLFQNKRARDAEKSFSQLVQLAPESRDAHRRLNFYYAMTRQRDALINESRRAIENGADIPQTYVNLVGADWMTFTNGWNVNIEWAVAHPDDSEEFEVASAIHLISVGPGDSEQRKKLLSKSAEVIKNLRLKYPKNKEVILLQLMYYVHLADARKVGEALNSLEIDLQKDSRYHRIVGWFYLYKEDWKKAEKSYLKCLELNPFDWQARRDYATVLRMVDRTLEMKIMQDSSNLGKEIMRKVLSAESTIDIPKSTLDLIIKYAESCGEKAVARSLSEQLGSDSAK